MAKKIEMLNDQQEVVHPLTSSDCVIMENGKTLEEVMGDGIATPTVTHEGASFQVGVGDSNIEVVDGDVAGMTLEGQTYQNILPKPTTLIMETDEKEFKINDKIDNNIVLDDNVAEIATIKGQTYVNAVQEESASEYVAIGEELNGQSITTTGKPEGYVKNATLEGLTLVNTIQEPSGADATVLELDADIDAQYATIDNTVQGGIHRATLKGQTLVNLSENLNTITRSTNDWYIQEKLMDNIEILKRNTYYTVLYRLESLSGNHKNYNGSGIGIGSNSFNRDIPGNARIIDKNGGWCKIVFKLTDDFMEQNPTYKQLYIRPIRRHEAPVEGESVDYTIRGFLILEGDYIANPILFNNVFKGMKSVEVPSVKTTGKNLFDGVISKGYLTDATGQANNILGVHSTNYMKCSPNSTYVISGTLNDLTPRFYFYDSSKNYLGMDIGTDGYKKFTTPSNAHYMRFRLFSDKQYDVALFNAIQIEEGSTATSYEPYQSSNTKVGLLPILETEQGCYYSASTGTRLTSNPNVNSVKYEVQGLSKVYVKVAHSNFSFWDSNDTYISGQPTITGGNNNEGYLGIPTNAVYMRCAVDNTKIAEVYKIVTLRKVGDVQDELDLETGKLTQRIGEVVLNGSESWWHNTDYVTDTLIEFGYNIGASIKGDNTIICDKFQPTDVNGVERIYMLQNGNVYIRILKTKVTTVDEFKTWLASNPITVQYVLKKLITRQIDLSIVDQSNNSLKTIQAQPTLTHITTSSNGLIPFVTIPSQLKYPTIIKPSTTYTVQLKHTTVNSNNPLTINLGGTTMPVPNTKFTITTPSELTSQDVIFTGKNNVIGEVVITEGDTTGIEYDFFEGMKDVKSPSMYATGKNLFDGEYELDKYLKQDGTISTSANWATTKNYIRVKPNTTYTQNIRMNSTIVYVVFYDKNKNIISAERGVDLTSTYNSATYTTPNNCYFIKTCYNYGYVGNHLFQIEEGLTVTSYEPYREGVTIEQSIDSIPLTSDMFEKGYYNYNNIIKGMSLQQLTKENSILRLRSKSLIPVKPNTTYQLSNTSIYIWALPFDKNGGLLGGKIGTVNDTLISNFTTDANTHYIAPVIFNVNSSETESLPDLSSLNLVLQEVTDEIVLRSIGDIKDTLNLTTGEYVQRIGEIVLDGSEDWGLENSRYPDTMMLFRLIDNTKLTRAKLSNNSKQICDKISIKEASPANVEFECFAMPHRSGIGYIAISKTKLETKDVSGFRKYLSENNMTFQYELATPIIKKVNLTNTTKLPSYTSTTHYDTIVPSNSLVPNIKIPSTVDYNVAIKPSTQYTIRANTTSAMSVNLGGSVGTLANGKVTLTTPSTLAHNSLKLGNGKAKEVMVIEGSEIKDNVPFFNGMKNVQMGGIKLVNIARGATCNSYVTTNANKTQFTYTANGTNWGYIIYDASLLKPNTTYTMFMNVITNQSDNNYPVKFELGSSSDGTTSIDNGFIGKFKSVRTSITKISNNLRIGFRPCTSGQQVVIQNPMIIEGDWTHLDEIPYIESEMIIEQPIIRSQGKNLFDGELEVGTVNSDTGLNMELSSRARTKSYIEIKPNTSYSMQVSDKSIINRIYYFDSSKKYISNQSIDSNNANRVSPQNAMYIRLSFANQSLTAITNDDINNIKASFQIEEGSTSTTYEPFKHQTLYSNRVIGYEEGCYYHYGTGNKETNEIVNSMLADVEGLSIAYVTGGSSNYTFWDKDNVFISGKRYLDTSLSSYDKNGFIAVPSNAKYMRFAAGMETNYKIATVTGELPLRSLPNGVCDTLNLVTGEYVQRVGEVVLDGSEDWFVPSTDVSNHKTVIFYCRTYAGKQASGKNTIISNIFPQNDKNKDLELVDNVTSQFCYVRISRERLVTQDRNGFKAWLAKNPITVQYELATPIVRKIGLTAKGNYKEIELIPSHYQAESVTGIKCIRTSTSSIATSYPEAVENSPIFTNDYNVRHYPTDTHGDYQYIALIGTSVYINIAKNEVSELTTNGCRRWLEQNPIKIGILTTNSASLYSNIQKPIFFNNVKVQFMNDNVDIQPTLTLQSTSRNSYVMDMMKANTVYTLKALKNSTPFTIDGTSYGAGTNGTFTSPSTLTNKLLITGQDVQELMIIEGDITRLTIPYYKGIRSAYDDVDEIEVLNRNKNLYKNGDIIQNSGSNRNIWSTEVVIKPNNYVTFSFKATTTSTADTRIQFIMARQQNQLTTGEVQNAIQGTNTRINGELQTLTLRNTDKVDGYCFVRFVNGSAGYTVTDIQIEETSTATSYQPHKENTTSLPMPTRPETVEVVRPEMENGAIENTNGQECASGTEKRLPFIPVLPKQKLIFRNGASHRAMNAHLYDINKNFIKYQYTNGTGDLVIPENCYFIRGFCLKANTHDLTITKQQYKPIALNSLPNGVKDEIIIEPVSNKAKLIQRVGKVVLDGSEGCSIYGYGGFGTTIADLKRNSSDSSLTNAICDKFRTTNYYDISINLANMSFSSHYTTNQLVFLNKEIKTETEWRNYLKQNPITVYYELETPITHEIRLTGFPFVYEDGSVQLNTELPHKTLVDYNVNQEQLINNQNETIIRHDKQMDSLYDYIELYLEEEYRMELFRMQLELSL